MGMTRREFIKRSAPLIASGAVSLSFFEKLLAVLFGTKRYWDFGAIHKPELIWKSLDDFSTNISLFPIIDRPDVYFGRYHYVPHTGRFVGNQGNCPICEWERRNN
jgi:hypothetical protein